jgi:hypothetical protein
MSADEVALASALLKPLATFDVALAWALSGKALGDDKVNERAAALSLSAPILSLLGPVSVFVASNTDPSIAPNPPIVLRQVRWKCAWDLLLARGWVVHWPELGYVIPTESRLPGTAAAAAGGGVGGGFAQFKAPAGASPMSVRGGDEAPEARLWERYVNHWARETVRMNTYARGTSYLGPFIIPI